MADKKFYIVPNRRTVTSGMKESCSYFLCPTNAVMTGRYHSGDENGRVSQNRNKLSFCHPERSEGSRKQMLMHPRCFTSFSMTLLFDRQFSFLYTLNTESCRRRGNAVAGTIVDLHE